ncbi:hypothetical protein Tco_0897969, partial [Tanacetum coccineum]
IKEYLVKVNKRRAFWSLNDDILKITILKTNMPYPSRRYGISVPELTKDHEGNKPNTSYPEEGYTPMNVPNITMEEYIRLEEEKARRRGKVFNWEAARYGKIWYDNDIDDLRSVETEFPAIVFNDNLKSEETLSCEPTVSSLHSKEIDFRISFDESDDEDYTIVFNKNSFLTEPTLSPQHIDEFNLKDETSLSECDEEEQNALNFNDLFSFNVIYPNDSKSDKDNDDNKVDIEHSSGDLSVKPLPDDLVKGNRRILVENLQKSGDTEVLES